MCGDTVNVQTVAGVTVVNTGADADTINVGSKAPDVNGQRERDQRFTDGQRRSWAAIR